MNPANTEIGKLLLGKEAEFNFNQMNKILSDEIALARGKLRGGLEREQYDNMHRKIASLATAQLILKSIQIYQSE